MRKWIGVAALSIASLAIAANDAFAWHLKGYVRCDANGNSTIDDGDLPLAGVTVTVTGLSTSFSASATTDAAGFYSVNLLDFGASYRVTITPPGSASIVLPTGGFADVSNFDQSVPIVDFLVDSSACAQQACWLTGGGAKFSPTAGILVAEKGPQHSFGGNVNPGCNPDSGEGGQWNHVAHALKRHIQGLQIRVVRCGNVPGIPEGSESPATPFNFIEFEGTGTVKPIQGNKDEGLPAPINFFARAEDRNEPGSSGAKDGAKIDRYFIHAWSGSQTWLLVDGDGNPLTIDPVPITDGNLQIHISSCSTQ